MTRAVFVAVTAIFALLIAPPSCFAQSDGKAGWNRLVEAAKKEGTVAVGGPIDPAVRPYLMKAWQKDFPGIELNYTVAGGFDWGNKLKFERENGKYLWDIYLNGPNIVMYNHAASGTFVDLQSALIVPELKEAKTWRRPWDELYMDSGRKMMSMFATPNTVWYNAKTVDPAKVERLGLDIMLEPQYKGRIGWNDPRTAGPGSNYSLFFYEVMGREKLKKLVVDNEVVFFARPTQASEALMRGKLDMIIALQLSDLKQYKDAGVEVDMRPIGTDAKAAYLGVGGAVLAVFDHAAHPNAAKLFANWMLSKEVQDGFAKVTNYDSMRADVAPASLAPMRFMPGENYVESQKERNLKKRDEAMAYIRELRPQ